MKENIATYFKPGTKAHLVGIGGVSMSPLAEVLQGAGLVVSGSDMRESEAVTHLRSLGMAVVIGHRGENVNQADLVIRTAAAHDDNPEILQARAKGIPVYERAEAWGALMQGYQNAICLSGTHGKTTTTSMCTHIFMAAKADPTVMIGGTLPLLGSGHRVGNGETIILESCEYCNSFHAFFPTVAVIMNIEADHLDFFRDLADVQQSFRTFAQRVPDKGFVVANCEDEPTMTALADLGRPLVTFGVEQGDVHTANLCWNQGIPTFDLVYQDNTVTTITLQVPGLHNVKNALAAATSALVLGVSPQAIAQGLGQFGGSGRRLERKGNFQGADVYDDYAHHPSELKALFQAVGQMGYRRVICAFQPHTYTRTISLFEDFVAELQAPDVTLVAEIYAAREENLTGISSKDLCDRIPGAIYCATLDEVTAQLKELAQAGDLVLTVGAGDIYLAGEQLCSLA